jgi:competence protein ComEC
LIPALPLTALAYAAGTFGAAFLGGPWWLTFVIAAALAIGLGMLARPGPAVLVLVAAIALASAGHARFAAAESTPQSPLIGVDGRHEIIGVTREDARVSGSLARTELEVERLDGAPSRGTLRLTVPAPIGGQPALRAGDRLHVRGDVRPARGAAFDALVAYPDEWNILERDVGAWPIDALRGIRRWALGNIGRALPEPEASLAAGVLIGEQRTMPAALTDALRATGTTHLVVVSGQNVAIVIGAVVAVLGAFVPRQRAGLAALLLLPAYVVLVGGGAPVLRAAVMAVGIAIAAWAGRRTPAWIFLAYAVAIMLALDPFLARDVSFQLSAAATAGVLLIAPPLAERIQLVARQVPGGPVLGAVGSAATVSVGAAIAVAPVQAAVFGTTSLVQVPANALVAPLYGGTVFVALLSALLGWLPPLAAILHTAGVLVPAAFVAIVEAMARVPGATVGVSAPLAIGIAWYAAAVVIGWALQRRESERLHLGAPRIGSTAALAVIAGGLWIAALAPQQPAPSVTVLDVGQGLAVLIRDGGAAVLVDTGPPDDAVLAALGRAGHRGDLDAVIVTHSDADHAGGLEAVRARVGAEVVLAAQEHERYGEVDLVDIGDRIQVGARTSVEVLAPPVTTLPAALDSDNDRSLVLLVTIGDRRILLPADIEAATEQWLARSGLDVRADALVVPHHGSKTSSTQEFLGAVSPRVAIISVGARNTYGHPESEVLARYGATSMYRTDEHGEVTLRSDGVRLWVEAARASRPQAEARATVTAR